MKRWMILFVTMGITVIIVLFPDVYYAKKDEKMSSYHKQTGYNLNRVDDIDLQKKLEILTDENSVYVHQKTQITKKTQKANKEMISDVIGQIVDILQIVADEKELVTAAMENEMESIQAINSSDYNVYSVNLRKMEIYSDEYEFTILFDANVQKIFYAQVLCIKQNVLIDGDMQKSIADGIKKYYGEVESYSPEISEYGVWFHIGSNKQIDFILKKCAVEYEVEEDGIGTKKNRTKE